MAKKQTFADKTKAKATEKISVKVIKGYTSEIGSTRFIEKIIRVDDLSELNKIDI
jgi:hypothetical protein